MDRSTYTNLTISGTSLKQVSVFDVTINNTLSTEGTAATSNTTNIANFYVMANNSTIIRNSASSGINSPSVKLGTLSTDLVNLRINFTSSNSAELSSTPTPGAYGTLTIPVGVVYTVTGGRTVTNLANSGGLALTPGTTLTFTITGTVSGPGVITSGTLNAASISLSTTAGPSAGTLNFDQTTPGTTNAFNNLIIDRTAGATFSNSASFNATTYTNGTLTLGAGATLTMNTTPVRTNGTIDASNSTAGVAFANALAITLPSGIFTGNVNNFTVNGAGGVTLASGLNPTIAGTLAMTTGTLTVGTNTLTISGNSPTRTTGIIDATSASATVAFTNGSAITIPSGLFNSILNNLTLNGAGGVTLSAALTVTGTLALTNGTLTVGANTLTLSGSSPTRTTGLLNASNAAATVAFTNASAISLPSGIFTGNVNNFTVNGAGGVTLGSATTVAGTLTLTTGTFTNGANLTMANNSTIVRTAGTLSAIPTYGSSATDVVNITINSGTATTSGNEFSSTVTPGKYGALTISLGTTYTITGGRTIVDLANNGVFVLAPATNSTLNITGTNTGSGLIRAGGAAATTANGASLNFAAALSGVSSTLNIDQSVPGTTNAFRNLTINRTSGNVTLSGDIILANALTMTAGTLTLGSNTLTLNNVVNGSSTIQDQPHPTLLWAALAPWAH